MRLTINQQGIQIYGVIGYFDRWLLDIGNGNCDATNKIIGCFNKSPGDKGLEDVIYIPKDMLVNEVKDLIKAIVETTYPNFLNKYNDPTDLEEKVVLTTKK